MSVLTNEQAAKELQNIVDRYWKMNQSGFVLDSTKITAMEMGIKAMVDGNLQDRRIDILENRVEDLVKYISDHRTLSMADAIGRIEGEIETIKSVDEREKIKAEFEQIIQRIYDETIGKIIDAFTD